MKTNLEWRRWGSEDPLFGVASWQGRELGGKNPWTDAEFYALGDDWLDFFDHWQRYGMRAGAAIEIGCGAGRITKRLAESFTSVIACDVSDGMLKFAREHVSGENIAWQLSDGASLPAPDSSLDAAFSCHVLQHLESNAAQLACFREIYRVLRPGGTFLIHLHLHEFPAINRKYSLLARAGYRAFLGLTSVKAALKRARMRFGGQPYMHGVSYETSALYADLRATGFQRVEFATFPVRTNGSLHTCVLGTKQASPA